MRIREFIDMVVMGNTEFDGLESEAKPTLDKLDRARKMFKRPANLPPDPEEENDNRAKWAANALACFAADTGEPPDPRCTSKERRIIMAQNLSDLLCDLAHYCDRAGLDFGGRLSTARHHYQEETAGQGTQLPAPTAPQAPAGLNARELATILHALRTVQAEGRIEGCAAGMCDHFVDVEPMTNAEIDDLCERINFQDIAGPTPRIIAILDGGIIQQFLADSPMQVAVIDYDVETADEKKVTPIPQGDGTTENAFAGVDSVEINPARCAELFKVMEG